MPLYIPRILLIVTANPAPEFIPIIPGAARLLDNTPCIMTPDTASAPPQSKEAIVRGRRTYKKIRPSVDWKFCFAALTSEENDISVLPYIIPKNAVSNNANIPVKYKILIRLQYVVEYFICLRPF